MRVTEGLTSVQNLKKKKKRFSKSSLYPPVEWVMLEAAVNMFNRGWKMQRHRNGDWNNSTDMCTQFQDGHEPEVEF